MNPKTILFVSPCSFTSIRQRHQAFAELFSKNGFETYFLDPMRTFGFSIFKKKINEINVLTPHVPFRASEWPGLQTIASKIIMKLLQRSELFTNDILWVADPVFSASVSESWKKIIYDRCDLHGYFPNQNKSAWRIHEKKIVARADHIIASSPPIKDDLEKMGAESGKISIVPNAADSDWIEREIPDVKPLVPLHVISAGAHFEWTDFAWLKMFAENSKIVLHIAGPGRGKEFYELIKHPRVKYHGIVDHGSLKKIFDSCHAGVIPFINIELTRAVDPIKAYEYKSRGLYVWVPPVPELISHSMTDSCIDSKLCLNETIEKLFESSTGSLKKKTPPSWEERFQTIIELLKDSKS
ncbi:MAG: glycosyltransferase [Candidatus Riflebacteria bacterium]|nr:glycosyltransferase [Candidatus Riflebacteria bacterium]